MPVRLITHESERGPSAARNTGIAASRGKYIAYLDDDDYYFENHLATLHDFLQRSGYRVAYTDGQVEIQKPINGIYRTISSKVEFSIDFSRATIYQGNITPVLCVMHERACLDRSGMFSEYLAAHEDWDLWLRMARRYDFAHIPEVTCAYTRRLDNSSLSSGRKDTMLETWIFTSLQGRFAQQVPPVNMLEEATRHVVRIGPEQPEPCEVSIVLSLASADAQTLRNLAALCVGIGDAQLVLVGSGLERASFEELHRALAGALPRPPLALHNAGEIGRILAANQGAEAATGEWLIFLEEDVLPQLGWLEALLFAASGQPDLGALGGVLRAPDLPPLAGGNLDADGMPVYAPLACDAATPFSPTSLVSGHCLMVWRERFVELGGFDPAFAPAHYADADLCLRLAERGHICGIAPAACLHWNKDALPLLQCPAGVLSLRVFQDKWASGARSATPDMRGSDWSRRPRLWPSDGHMPPKDFTMDIPKNFTR
jgi:glycosyltransferase involved in cell wall biosynthesis